MYQEKKRLAWEEQLPQEFTSQDVEDIKDAINVPRANVNITPYHIYDEDEHQVGEWLETISGVKKKKPVYENRFTGVLSGSSTEEVLQITNIERYINGYGFAEPDVSIPFANNTLYLQLNPEISNQRVVLKRAQASHWANNAYTVIIRYTKTTDEWEVVQ